MAVVPIGVADATEHRLGSRARLIAITHGDPQSSVSCGRPVYARHTQVTEKRSADLVYVCPMHGDLVETKGSTSGGYTGAFAFFAEDVRPRRKSE